MPAFSIVRSLAIATCAALFVTGCAPAVIPPARKVAAYNPCAADALPSKIVIELAGQWAYLYIGDKLDYSAPISSGREGYNTPPGRYWVTEKDIDHASSAYGSYVSKTTGQVVAFDVDTRTSNPPPDTVYKGAPMPYFLRFSGGYGLHQGKIPRYPASHGCIRLPAGAAPRFYASAKVGTPVIVNP